ncbi:uncharacterized protein EAE98_012316 [Botrytis deweyae]|uniref:GATA-type domain-containing protein n=1 Tax=Botrytis deweyae TaxID=2478750 RepID=A0ABQ7I3E3_9HELO|nr:uncharacterized protein EAE98_012316 [Botrytis deweyae]KAF7909104.1 hypothetical protein EAE98_012316 [Botrytis deweyae]
MEHRLAGGPQDHPNYNTTVTSTRMSMDMLTSGYAPGTEPIAPPPNATDDPDHCAGCGASTSGARRWKETHLHSHNECKRAYQDNTCKFTKIPAADPNGDNIAFDDYGDYDAYADNAPSAAVSYDTQQSVYPQASSSAPQAESYYPETTTGTAHGGQYSSTTGGASQNEQYYPASSSASQVRGHTTTSQYRGGTGGSRGYRGAGNNRRD